MHHMLSSSICLVCLTLAKAPSLTNKKIEAAVVASSVTGYSTLSQTNFHPVQISNCTL